MVIRVDRSTVPASYIRSYLLTQVGYLQIQSTIRGITAHSYPSDVKLIRIPIPNVSNSQREYWLKTDEWMLLAGQFQDYAELLTTAAKLLVEALIEGNLQETELKAAQKALQQGDNSLDREILSRLTRKGYNVSGEPPIFPDLNDLYKVLQEAETNQEVE